MTIVKQNGIEIFRTLDEADVIEAEIEVVEEKPKRKKIKK